MIELSRDNLIWCDSFAVGHPSLDSEHRRLVDLINTIDFVLCDEPDAGCLMLLLQALHRMASEHLLHEEALMREITSETCEPWRSRITPRLKRMLSGTFAKHFQEHEAKRSALDEIIVGPIDQLSERLPLWFIEHVHSSDADLKALLQMVT